MALEQDLQNEIQNFKTIIIALELQSNLKMKPVLKVAKAHLKRLKDDLELIKSIKRTPNLELLNFEEHAELHLENAKAFLNSVSKGY